MKTVLSFATTSDAMACESECKEEGMPGRIIPTPSSVSAGCGLSWAAPILYKEELLVFCRERKLRYDKVTDLEI